MPRNKYPEETVQKILDTSTELFQNKGFEQTTILDIVDNLGGLTRGAFYHHFKSKEEVLDAIINQWYNRNSPFERAQHTQGLTAFERGKLAIRYSLEGSWGEKNRALLSKASLPLLSNPRFLAEHVKYNRETSKQIEIMLEEGVIDGSINITIPAKMLSELIMLLFNFWTLPSVYPCNKEEFIARFLLIKDILDNCGLPIIDEEVLEIIRNVSDYVDFDSTAE